MYPCNLHPNQTPALYTYYAVMSLIVVILAISLMWIPFVQLIAELNTIIAKVVIYANKEVFGNKNSYYIDKLEAFVCSPTTLLLLAVLSIAYFLYLASADFLMFAGCYILNLPNNKYFNKVKTLALYIIDYLLSLTAKKKCWTIRADLIAKLNSAKKKKNSSAKDDQNGDKDKDLNNQKYTTDLSIKLSLYNVS